MTDLWTDDNLPPEPTPELRLRVAAIAAERRRRRRLAAAAAVVLLIMVAGGVTVAAAHNNRHDVQLQTEVAAQRPASPSPTAGPSTQSLPSDPVEDSTTTNETSTAQASTTTIPPTIAPSTTTTTARSTTTTVSKASTTTTTPSTTTSSTPAPGGGTLIGTSSGGSHWPVYVYPANDVGGQSIATATPDATGAFTIEVPSGTYVLDHGEGVDVVCRSAPLAIGGGATITVTFTCAPVH
jgi:cytoskeletal protein RodZ